MKSRLNLTIEDSLIASTKQYAEKHHTSVSELVESYLKEITTPVKRKNFVDLMKELGEHHIDPKADLKDLYYNDPEHGG